MITGLILVLHVVFSLAMIGFILMHRGTGGGLSDMFGGGMSNLQGSAIVERNLDRLTVVCGTMFGVTSILLALRL